MSSDATDSKPFRRLSKTMLDTEVDDLFGEQSDWLGRTIDGRYRVLDKLGEGGMGAIYIAEHLTLGKRVALKTVHPHFAGDGAVAERFAREATATAKLDHPHVASAIDYGLLPEGGAYLVMQLVQGVSLHEAMDRHGRIAWPRAAAIAEQIADALSAAHAQGIVHRDLKPENVMLEPRDDGSELVKVLDFGIARVQSATDSVRPPSPLAGSRRVSGKALTQVGMVVGTPGYMAPEQAKGLPVDHRADLYALGVLLWEMISGEPLFDDEDFREILAQQLANQIPRLAEAVPDEEVPDELQQLVDLLITVKPERRAESAAAVREALREITMAAIVAGDTRARTAMGRLTPTPGRISLGAASTQTPTLDRGHFDDRRGGLKVWALSIAGAIALAGVILAVAYVVKSPEQRAQESPELMQELFEKAKQVHAAQELERQVGLLFTEQDKDLRRQSALYLLDYEPADEVDNYVRAVANLELARGCRPIRTELEAIESLADPRALPAVKTMADTPHTCGRRNRSDCYACVRSDLNRVVELLETTERARAQELAGESSDVPGPDEPATGAAAAPSD